MHLFLTSSPCDDDGARGLGIPFVYSEANGFARRLRERVAPGVRGVMIAAYPDSHERNDAMAADFGAAFGALGRPLSDMRMLDGRHSPEEIAEAVAASGAVILSGGHVPTQNSWFRGIGLGEILAGYGGTVIGISAGSMNCCGCVYAQPEEPGEAADPQYRRFIPGLALTGVMILPHFQTVRRNRVDGLRLFEDITVPDSAGRVFYAIPDGSYVLQEDGAATMYGESLRIADGRMEPWTSDGEERRIAD
ncbi:MAG: Type 1 glutamine amidotransferase-like domain-containing protein [Clostridia bacterium]|nr:Type 1 glutamine amidotransferase-like domain-containing protein [Clostridia bacterium]